jgi:hypothetical protein
VRKFVLVWALCFAVGLYAQEEQTGDAAIAAKYVQWAEDAINKDRWAAALAGLERAADFSNASSDVSYLLGLARFHEGKALGTVLEALRLSQETNRWKDDHRAVKAALLEAEALIQLRLYGDALGLLSRLPPSGDVQYFRLLALKGLEEAAAFRSLLVKTLESYPWDPRPVRLCFEYAAERLPDARDEELVSLALRRLPFLLDADKDLAYLGAPFMRNPDDVRRVLSAYRAMNTPAPASIPMALNLGLIDGKTAVEELFPSDSGEQRLDKALLLSVWDLLRTNEERSLFSKRLGAFSGIITVDAEKDGYPEYLVSYRNGSLVSCSYDADQDRLPEYTVSFEANVPVRMNFVLAPDAEKDRPYLRNRQEGLLRWAEYPAVAEVSFSNAFPNKQGKAQSNGRYQMRPLEFFVMPVYLKRLVGEGLWFPEWDQAGTISMRSVLTFASFVERPSREFDGALERIDLDWGVPQRAYELLKGTLVSETEFALGRPLVQRLDLDLNGRMDTVRRFRQDTEDGNLLESSEADWNGDGLFEYGETYTYVYDKTSGLLYDAVLPFWQLR